MHRSHNALVARRVDRLHGHGRWVRFPHGWLGDMRPQQTGSWSRCEVPWEPEAPSAASTRFSQERDRIISGPSPHTSAISDRMKGSNHAGQGNPLLHLREVWEGESWLPW